MVPLRSNRFRRQNILTFELRQIVELLPPLLTDVHKFVLIIARGCDNSVAVGMLDELLGVFGVERVHHVEEVAPVRHPTLWQLIREVDHHLRFVLELGVEVLDAKFLEFWHLNHFDFSESQQLFLLKQNLTQKVFVEHGIRRHI